MPLDAAQRSMRARRAALIRWARKDQDSRAQAVRGQEGLLDKFRAQVLADDPEVVEPELTVRAKRLLKAHMVDLAFRASKSKGLT